MAADPTPAPLPGSIAQALATRAGDAMALNDRYLNPQLGRIVRTLGFDRTWTRGEGAHLIDAQGNRYLDLLSGYGTFAVGRNNPDVIAALHELLDAHSANLPQLGVSVLPGLLAEQLVARAPERIVAMVPANTGTEAVEAAIKLARATTGRGRILYASHAFHGLTLGSLSLNGDEQFREGFGPLVPGCDRVPWGDLDALRREFSGDEVAAFIIEPVQGKGVNLPPEGYLAGAQALCREHGAMFVCDEVQTGLGRTGRFLALEHWGLDPDMICVAKALSGGFVPIGGVLVSARRAFDRVFDGMERGVRHGSTFGGNDIAAAAALATLGVIEREGRGRARRALGDAAARADPAAGRSLRDRPRRARPGADVGDRARPAGAARPRARCGSASSARSRGLVRAADHRAAVPAPPHLLPGRRPPHERRQGAARAARSRSTRSAASRRRSRMLLRAPTRMGSAVGRLGWDLARGSARALRR